MLRLIASRLSLHLWRLRRWQHRRQCARWRRHYRQAVLWHSHHGPLEASAMAHGRLLDAPGSVRRCPITCAMEDLGHPVEDLL